MNTVVFLMTLLFLGINTIFFFTNQSLFLKFLLAMFFISGVSLIALGFGVSATLFLSH
jgi:hypothetical protein